MKHKRAFTDNPKTKKIQRAGLTKKSKDATKKKKPLPTKKTQTENGKKTQLKAYKTREQGLH